MSSTPNIHSALFIVNKKEIMLLTVPERSVSFEILDKESSPRAVIAYVPNYELPYMKPGMPTPIWPIPDDYFPIGLASELWESQWGQFTPPVRDNEWIDYTKDQNPIVGLSNKASGISLVVSKGFEPSRTLILAKKVKMEWTEQLLINFALFHAKRMRGAYQTDSEFYAKDSLKIFTDLQGDVSSYHFS